MIVPGRRPPSRWSCSRTLGALRTVSSDKGAAEVSGGTRSPYRWATSAQLGLLPGRWDGMAVGTGETTRIIRPAAILDERAAVQVLQQLRRLDVSAGGTWNATSSPWQRYDPPRDGPGRGPGAGTWPRGAPGTRPPPSGSATTPPGTVRGVRAAPRTCSDPSRSCTTR